MIFFNKIKLGFTLVETLVYMGVFSIVFTVIVQFSLATLENNRIAFARKELGDLIILTNSSLEESFANSSSINLANTVFNSDNGKIALTSPSDGAIDYSLQIGRIRVNRGINTNDLTTADFNCNKLHVNAIMNGTEYAGVIIEIRCTSVKFSQVSSTFRSNYFLP